MNRRQRQRMQRITVIVIGVLVIAAVILGSFPGPQ